MSSLFDHTTFPRNVLDGSSGRSGDPVSSRGYESVIRSFFPAQLTCAETKMWKATIRKEIRTRFRLRRRQSSSWVTPVTSAMTRIWQPKQKIDHIMEKRVKFALHKSFVSAAKILIIEVSEWHLNLTFQFHLLLLCWYDLVVDDYNNAVVVVSVVLLTLLLLLGSGDDDDDDRILAKGSLYCLISRRSI